MSSNLQVIKKANFNGIKFNCYAQESDTDDFWATREQIGKILNYANPRLAIGKIHERNKERLDKFSSEVKLTTEAGIRTATVYNFKGLLEICRYSNQPKANAVIDFLWDIADEIRRKGAYISKALTERIETLEAANKEMREYIASIQPATTVGKLLIGAKQSYTFQEAAQILAQHGFNIGQNKLYERGRKKKLLCSRKGKQWNHPTQYAIEQGFLNLVADLKNRVCVMVTPKLLARLADELTQEQMPVIYLIDRSEVKELEAE